MVEDTAVITDQPSTESVTQGKMRNENNCMPARSINMYDDFTVNNYISILYGRGYRSDGTN